VASVWGGRCQGSSRRAGVVARRREGGIFFNSGSAVMGKGKVGPSRVNGGGYVPVGCEKFRF
jgi:hypothetical protein